MKHPLLLPVSALACMLLCIGSDDALALDPLFTDDDWMAIGGGFPGPDGFVRTVVSDGAGTVYVGGNLTMAGRVLVNNVAKWDGVAWAALGEGFNDAVETLALYGSDLVAGGWFTQAGTQEVHHVARWDGSEWLPLGDGMGGAEYPYVYALAVFGGDLYAGGDFTTAGGIETGCIARWDGTQWSSLGSGVGNGDSPPSVRALAVSETDLYVGGAFRTAGQAPASFVARWDGNGWSALGHGVYGWVHALALLGDDLYVAGRFKRAGSIWPWRIAKWDGDAWSTLGDGLNRDTEGKGVNALTVYGGDLYAGGLFDDASGVAVAGVARWDGHAWYAVEGVKFAHPQDMTVSGGRLLLGGSVQLTDESNHALIAYDGAAWSALGTDDGLGGEAPAIWAVKSFGDDLAVGGTFATAAGEPVGSVARWDGGQWHGLGTGVSGEGESPGVYAVETLGDDLYVGGDFTTAGAVPANGVARWDGRQWSGLGDGIGGDSAYVYRLKAVGDDLVAGGIFTTAGGLPVNHIARWNGDMWSPLGTGVGGDGAGVSAIEVWDETLYVAGTFTTAGGSSVNRIAAWNGSNWSPLGAGLDGPWVSVLALEAVGDRLYAAGGFSTAGGIPAANIAMWDGATWSPVGEGLGGDFVVVYALAVSGGYLFAGGMFTEAGGASARGIACWDGARWSAVGSGFGSEDSYKHPVAFVVSDSALYAAGDFDFVGGKVSRYLARLRLDNLPLLFGGGPPRATPAVLLTRLLGPQGQSVLVESSSNVTDWDPVVTGVVPSEGLPLSLSTAGEPARAYRARPTP